MHNREFFYNNYKNHPEHVLQRIAGEYPKLTPQAQEALRDVLQERGFESLLATLKVEDAKENLSRLSKDEVRRLINSRLAAGENIELIKMDLRDKGVDIFEFAMVESSEEEQIDERMIELRKEGRSKSEIESAIRKEFNRTPEAVHTQHERMLSNGSGMIVAGALMLLITVPLAAVVLQSGSHYQIKYLLGIPLGLGLLIMGIRKRRAAEKMNGM